MIKNMASVRKNLKAEIGMRDNICLEKCKGMVALNGNNKEAVYMKANGMMEECMD